MKKILAIITLFITLVGTAFTWNFKEYGTFENEKAGIYTVLIDFDATEPFDIEKENIRFLLYLQDQENYEYVTVHYYNPKGEGFWCKEISEKYKIYCTLEVYDDYDFVYHVCDDGRVVEYLCIKNKDEE